MKKLFLNKIIQASQKKTRGAKGIILETVYPVPMFAQINVNKKNPHLLSVLCRSTDRKNLKLFAKAVFNMYKKEFGKYPNKIDFLTPEGKISIRQTNIDSVHLNPLLTIKP